MVKLFGIAKTIPAVYIRFSLLTKKPESVFAGHFLHHEMQHFAVNFKSLQALFGEMI